MKPRDHRVQQFLDAATRKLKGENKIAVQEELASHIKERITESERQGIPTDAAILQAIKELGTDEVIAQDFHRLYRPWYLHPFVMTTSALIAILMASSEYASYHLRRSIMASNQKNLEVAPLFYSDQEILNSEAILVSSRYQKDADDFITNNVPVMPTSLNELLNKKSVLELVDSSLSIEANSLDLSWMQKLHQFDSWDSAPNESNGKLTMADVSRWPSPEYEKLRNWAKMRLARSLQTGDTLAAMRDVRQLAQLIYTNESLVADMVALALLNQERAFADWAVKNGYLQKGSWLSPSLAWTKAFKRTVWASAELFNYSSDESLFRKVFLENGIAHGRCSALAEGLRRAVLLRPYLTEDVWGSKTYAQRRGLMSEALERSQGFCRLKKERILWSTPNLVSEGENVFSINGSSQFFLDLAKHVPFLRRSVGEFLMNFGSIRSFERAYSGKASWN
jgi:hypothetical protein